MDKKFIHVKCALYCQELYSAYGLDRKQFINRLKLEKIPLPKGVRLLTTVDIERIVSKMGIPHALNDIISFNTA